MATHKSALKRARQNKDRRLRNMSYKTRVKTAVKEVRTAIDGNSPEKAQETFSEAVSMIQKTASRGVIHRKHASRKISRLARRLNKLQATS